MSTEPVIDFPICPFCGYKDSDVYVVSYHIEKTHTEDSPFVAQQERDGGNSSKGQGIYEYYNDSEYDSEDDPLGTYVTCPEKDCGEPVLLAELQNHMDMHGAERIAMSDMGQMQSSKAYVLPPFASGSSSPAQQKHHSLSKKDRKTRGSEGSSSSKSQGSSSRPHKKSTKSGLGPYAKEKHMPGKLYQQLLQGPSMVYQTRIGTNGKLLRVGIPANETPGLIQVISQLLERDPMVERAGLCDATVRHVWKQLPREGGFCGYRNIQMLITHIQGAYLPGSHPFNGVVPTIIKIQHDIERGWDNGINAHGRAETGGIKGTRKYIGTSEAETFFTVQGIRCKPVHISTMPDRRAQDALFDFVERWYEAGRPAANTDRVLRTSRPPIYFQHAGHSMTIIGFEKRTDGLKNVLVFDPTFATSPAMSDLIRGKKIKSKIKPDTLLAAYRRGTAYLGRYNEFELLILQ